MSTRAQKRQFCVQIRGVSTKTACNLCSPRNKDSFHEKNLTSLLRFSLVKLHVKTSSFEVLFVWTKYFMFIFCFPTNALLKTAYGLCSPIYKLSFETFPSILRRDFIWSNSLWLSLGPKSFEIPALTMPRFSLNILGKSLSSAPQPQNVIHIQIQVLLCDVRSVNPLIVSHFIRNCCPAYWSIKEY